MDTLSIIVVSDETSPVRRFELRKLLIKRAAIGAAVFVVMLLGLGIDYVRVRLDNHELASLRKETRERREQVVEFERRMGEVDGRLARLSELERKVRIIANLPGSTASGGEEVTAVGGESESAESDHVHGGQGGLDESFDDVLPAQSTSRLPTIPADADEPQRVSLLQQTAEYLGAVAEGQNTSLAELVHALEGKQNRLASSPSVWPANGWLTSRFGHRISPFTGRRQFHAGLDIAAAPGSPVRATARGKVVFAGDKGPLGRAVTIDHGFGVRTVYGHNQALLVKVGQTVERGEKIASLGNSGRSTGPHLHYAVEVNGKSRNPLDYIFD
jgi:murein DD-endopeptidase MepM/ murein hydrolase activator NlpD